MPDWLIFLAFLGMAPFWLPWVIVLLGVAVVSIGGAICIAFETIATVWRGK